MLLSTYLAGTICFAADANTLREGVFLGLGANYNSINLTQNSWGKGISNIQTSTGANSTGIAQGDGAPFKNITNALGPEIQVGYFKHIGCSPNLLGVKFSYQYLGSTATNSNLFIPQLGETTNTAGTTSSLYGYVNANSVEVTTNHQLNLLAFIGQSFCNTFVYFGVGPSLVNLKSKNYYSIGYANFEGATLNVTGLVSYASPSVWAWGGTAQLGASYFLTPTWFIDMAYSYTATANKAINHQQPFTNTSSLGSTTYTTTGTLFTKNTLSLKNQTLMLSINKVLDC